MSKSKGHDDKEATILDEYYKGILLHVKPYIQQLKNTKTAQIYKEWIERLNCSTNQRILRNQYLEALYEELKSGRVAEIFNKSPPKGFLPPIPQQSITEPDSYSEASESTQVYHSPHSPWMRCRQFSQEKNAFHEQETDSTTSQEERLSPKVQFSLEKKSSRVQLNVCKERIEELTAVAKRLHIENEHLSRELSRRQGCGDVNEMHHLRAVIKQKNGEINEWKSRLMKVQQMKRDLEGSHNEVIQQCKRAMNEQFKKFKARLLEETMKNQQLKEDIIALTQKVERLTCEKADELVEKQKEYELLIENIQRQFSQDSKKLETINQELCKNNEVNVEVITQLNNKIQDLENKLQSKTEEESKLRLLLDEQYSTMKEELTKIRNEMESANQKKIQELTEKISSLKRSLLKIEKSKQKIVLEYKQKIFELEKNKEIEMKTLELQLQGQRNELSTSLSTEKQCELDSLLNMLEERYKSLLVSTEAIADNQRQKYLQKMTDLEDQLSRLKNTLITDGTYV